MAEHECRVCGNKFESEKDRDIHMGLQHPDEARKELGLVCDKCGKDFNSRKVMQTHVEEVHGSDSSAKKAKEKVLDYLKRRKMRDFLSDNWEGLLFLGILAVMVLVGGIGGDRQQTGPAGNQQAPLQDDSNSSTGAGSNPYISGELPEKTQYNSCISTSQCTPTCCGAYNKQYTGQCSRSPPCGNLTRRVAVCKQNRCVLTDQMIPEDELQ